MDISTLYYCSTLASIYIVPKVKSTSFERKMIFLGHIGREEAEFGIKMTKVLVMFLT